MVTELTIYQADNGKKFVSRKLALASNRWDLIYQKPGLNAIGGPESLTALLKLMMDHTETRDWMFEYMKSKNYCT